MQKHQREMWKREKLGHQRGRCRKERCAAWNRTRNANLVLKQNLESKTIAAGQMVPTRDSLSPLGVKLFATEKTLSGL